MFNIVNRNTLKFKVWSEKPLFWQLVKKKENFWTIFRKIFENFLENYAKNLKRVLADYFLTDYNFIDKVSIFHNMVSI